MPLSVYYNTRDSGLLITSNFGKYQERINLGIFPNFDFKEILLTDIGKFPVKAITFDEIEATYLHDKAAFFSKLVLDDVAVHNSNADISNLKLDVKHIIIGDQTKVSLDARNFNNLEAITFLSLKSFKGKFLSKFESVKKLIVWYENKKSNELLAPFPSLKEFEIYNGSLLELDLSQTPSLEQLQLHRCLKLERIILNPETQLKKVLVENCKKLDISNLGKYINQF